jgi:hypothetical protein
MGASTIAALKNLVHGFCFGHLFKWTTMSLVRDAVYVVEVAIALNAKNSKLISSIKQLLVKY